MAAPFGKGDRPGSRLSFSITRNDAGNWVARERPGGLEWRFASQRAALHFVLFEFNARSTTALLTPCSDNT